MSDAHADTLRYDVGLIAKAQGWARGVMECVRGPRGRRRRGVVALRMAPVRVAVACLALAAVVLLCPADAFALDAALDVSQYAHTAWKVRDGFVKGAIIAIAQTPDGYLWLGTEFGLYRFDGVRAVPWQPPAGEQLPSIHIRKLLMARDGTLWIATLKGLASWKDGKLANYPELAGQTVTGLFQDRGGTVWFGAYAPGRLCAVQGGRIECYGAGSFGLAVIALYEDRKGNLWVSASTGVWRWKPGRPEQYSFPRGVTEANSLIEDDNGTLLLATNAGLKQLAGGRIQDYAVPGLVGRFRPSHFLRSRDGGLWIGSMRGLLYIHQGRTDRFEAADGLTGDFVSGIFEDREGSVWLGTMDGLDRFREYAIPSMSLNEGLSNSLVWSVQATSDGSIWLGTPDGLNRWQNGHVTVYGKPSGPSQSGRRDERHLDISRAVTGIANPGLAGYPHSLGSDDQGQLWVSTGDGVFYFKGGRFIRLPGVAGGNVYGIATDGHGKEWISNDRAGLLYVTPGEAVQTIPWSQLGHKGYGARALLPDRSQGVWLGFYEGGLFYFKDGKVRASYTAADGLGNGRVNDLRFGPRGTLWAATEGGLSRIRDGHVTTLTSKNGLPCDEVHWSVEDDDHFVWLYMPCGLARIARSELDAWVSDPSRKLKLEIFDNSDGVLSIGVYGGYGPHVTKSPDGKIWFVHGDGVGVIDPRHMPFNKLPPPVLIEQITADRKSYDPAGYGNGHVPLPARTRDLEIDYAALSFVAPEKVRFRYKLEGRDSDWQEAGNRRQAFYSDLAPRDYRFRVAACNNSGVWNEEGAFVDFAIAPAYYQTTWFGVLCIAGFLGLLWALYQYRLHQIQRQFSISMEAREGERLRIARDLHDTLLQSFQGLLLRFQTACNLLPDRPEEAKQKFENAIDLAAQAITEGRNAVQGLRSSTTVTNELAEAVSALAIELGGNGTSQSSPVFRVDVEGEAQDLHPLLRDEVYRIAGEALRNSFRHGQADRIEVEIHYDTSQLRVRIRDNGRGIAREVVESDGRAGHWGLHGMRERAKIIGGNLEVWSSPQSGTEVELTIPARAAYATVGHRRSWFSRKAAAGAPGREASQSHE